MRIVWWLCHCLATLVMTLMDFLRYIVLYSVSERLWHRFGRLWRCVTARLRPLVGRALSAIGWRQDPGEARHKPEINNTEGVAWSDSEDQHTTVAQERAAVSNTEPDMPSLEQHCSSELESREARDEPMSEEEYDADDEFGSERYRVETADELYCVYDSTWETEESQWITGHGRSAPSRSFVRFENAARDMQNYRHGYPYQTRFQHRTPCFGDKPNLEFYLGERHSVPDGLYIHDFHNEWFRSYDALEYVHTYIQWLFPLEEPGMNAEASPLTKDEVKDFRANKLAKENLLKSYKLMLDFYGIELCNEETGEVRRAPNWRERFQNLNSHSHNNLRITRILKCQGTLGYSHYQAPLVYFFLKETLIHRELPNVKDSVLNYFVFAVLDKRQRRSLIKFAYMNYNRKNEFVWCPKKIQMLWSGQQT